MTAAQVPALFPAGFVASGVAAGIKASGNPDLALVVNQGPQFSGAGVFTSNRVFAAPVGWSRLAVADGTLRAVVLNSGGANACTGAAGYQDTVTTADAVGAALDCPPEQVAVCSTGLIGVRLPMPELLSGIETAHATLSREGGPAAAEAIMTTDSVAKTASLETEGWRVWGMAKGAGMLAPGLATMLVVVLTDAQAGPEVLDRALREATRVTLDRLDSDGCMSTNDTVLAMASGASGVAPSETALTEAITALTHDLGQQLLRDAEGASHDVSIVVAGAASEDDAVTIGRAVARSNLFKTAIFGNDPNWGRVLSAIGTTDAAFDADDLDVSFNGVMVCRGGAIGEDRSLVDLSGREVTVGIDLHAGDHQATVWTNDLTYDYVKENAEYSS